MHSGDGAYCRLIYRPASSRAARYVARYASANTVTSGGLVIGLLGAACIAWGSALLGAVLVQAFEVVSCLDGDTARLREEVSAFGAFYDTIVDRVVELAVASCLVVRATGETAAPAAAFAGLAYVATAALLFVTSEKFRSTYGTDYPKTAFESAFAWLTAGSDARLFVLSAGIAVAVVARDWSLIAPLLWGVSAVALVNFAFRMQCIARYRPS